MILGGSHPYRQRMINLMYLVFIALLAMKVSPRKEEQATESKGATKQTEQRVQTPQPASQPSARPQLEALVLPLKGPSSRASPPEGGLSSPSETAAYTPSCSWGRQLPHSTLRAPSACRPRAQAVSSSRARSW